MSFFFTIQNRNNIASIHAGNLYRGKHSDVGYQGMKTTRLNGWYLIASLEVIVDKSIEKIL